MNPSITSPCPCRKTSGLLYAKPPFSGPDDVLEYIGRYTHRVAISNERIISLEEGKVTFGWRNRNNPKKPSEK